MTETNCIFCSIIKKEIPSKIVYEDEEVMAFEDINPAAPVHILIIPKQHIATLNDLKETEEKLAGKLLKTAALIAKDKKIDQTGYRTIFNTNANAGQVVFHIHLHLLGGRKLTWPPG
ncbi:MAG: histidine triad nucleotide-binding protein [bacterium]